MSRYIFVLAFIIGLCPSGTAYARKLRKIHHVSHESATLEGIPARQVVVKFDAIDGALFYSILIRTYGPVLAPPYETTSKKNEVRVLLTPGHYLIRVQAVKSLKKHSEWSDWKEFWVHLKPPTNVSPTNWQMIVPKLEKNRRVAFQWPRTQLAVSYFFKLIGPNGDVVQQTITKNTHLAFRLPVNNSYEWAVQPLVTKDEINDSNMEFDWHQFSVGSPLNGVHTVSISAEQKRRAKLYEFRFIKYLSDKVVTAPFYMKSPTSTLKVPLPPGHYEVQTRSIGHNQKKSPWSQVYSFFIGIPPPTLVSPLFGKIVEATDFTQSKVQLRWRKINEAEIYNVKVYSQNGDLLINKLTRENRITVELPHLASYRWMVTSYNFGETLPDTRFAQRISPADLPSADFSINRYIPLDLNSAEESSQLYGWMRYLISNMNFTAGNYDNGTRVNDTLFGGYGETALGFWRRKTNDGLLATYTYSGLHVNGFENFFWNDWGLLYGKRYLPNEQTRIRWWFGAEYAQTPEVLYSSVSSAISFSRISTVGPEARAAYLYAFNKKWGAHVDASAYYGLASIGTPNGLSAQPGLSYSFGLLATYKLSRMVTSMFGYAYQIENAAYTSTYDNHINTVQLGGSFFSFALEFGLETPER